MSDYDYEDTPETPEAEKPAAPEAGGRSIDRTAIAGGWGTATETRAQNSPYADRLRIEGDDGVLVKFLDTAPYTSFHFHWIERQGQKSWTCIDRLDNRGCPLCKAGDRPSARFAFNVALMTPDGDPVVKSFEGGVRVMETIKKFHDSQTQGPIDKHYWRISKSGKGTSTQTLLQMVKERDLIEDPDANFHIAPITDSQMVALNEAKYDASIVPVPGYDTLQKIAMEDLDVD